VLDVTVGRKRKKTHNRHRQEAATLTLASMNSTEKWQI